MTGSVDTRLPDTPSRNMDRRLRTLVWTFLVALSLLLIWCGILFVRIVTFQGTPAAGTPLRTDAGIVLGASLWNDKPSPGLRERLDHALSLYRQGVFPRFIVTGGLDAGGATITEAEGMRNYLLDQGVPEDAVYLDTKSRSTYENLMYAKEILAKGGWRTAVIVTHRYHGARATDIATTVGYQPVIVSVTETKVMNMAYHETREILAFTKWQLNKLRLAFG